MLKNTERKNVVLWRLLNRSWAGEIQILINLKFNIDNLR